MGQEKSANLRQTVGGIVSLVAGLVTIIFGVVFLFSQYNIILKGFSEAGKNAGVVMQSVHQPIFTQILGLAGIMLLVGAYGFFIKRNWAWVVAFIGSTIGVFGGFMLMMFPLMVLLPMKHIPTFLLCTITWFVLTLYVRPYGKKLVAFSFTCGMAMTMTFMNGNAALNKIIGVHLKMKSMNPDAVDVGMIMMMAGNPGLIYQAIQQVLWVGALGLFFITIAVFYRRDWVLPVGIGSAIISLVAGAPVAYIDTVIDKAGEKLSMFSFAPFLAAIILIVLLVFREKIWSEEEVSSGVQNTEQVSV